MKINNYKIRNLLKKQIKFVCDKEMDSLKPGNVHKYSEGHGMNVKDFFKSSLIDNFFGTILGKFPINPPPVMWAIPLMSINLII